MLMAVSCLLFSAILGCKKDENSTPDPTPNPDTVGVAQYVVCKIDTIQYLSVTTSGSDDTIAVTANNSALTEFYSSTRALQNGQQLRRNLLLTLNGFQSMQEATYTGAKIFAKSNLDVLQNGSEIDEQSYDIFNATGNKITVTEVNDSLVRGTFNFRMRNGSVSSKFIEVTDGHFKIRIK